MANIQPIHNYFQGLRNDVMDRAPQAQDAYIASMTKNPVYGIRNKTLYDADGTVVALTKDMVAALRQAALRGLPALQHLIFVEWGITHYS